MCARVRARESKILNTSVMCVLVVSIDNFRVYEFDCYYYYYYFALSFFVIFYEHEYEEDKNRGQGLTGLDEWT